MQNDKYVFINLFKKVIKKFLTMSASTNVIKRPRKSNFSPAECTLLLELAEEKLSVIHEKFSNMLNNKMKANIWKSIMDKIKDKWRTMVSAAKKDYSRTKQQQKQTGGGSAKETSRRIIELFEDKPSFSGITGDIESGKLHNFA